MKNNKNKQINLEKALNPRATLKKLYTYISSYKLSLILIFIFSIGSTVFAIVGPKVLGNATTELFEGFMGKISGTSSIDFDAINYILVTLCILYLVSAILSYLQNFIMSNVSQKITYKMRKDISEKINRMPLSFFEGKNYGEIQSTIVNDVDTLSQGLNQSVTQLITSVTMLIGILVMMISINVIITLITLLILPISGYLVAQVVKRSQKYFRDAQNLNASINGSVEEMYHNQVVVKAFNAEEKVLKEFNEYNDELYIAGWKSQFVSGIMMPLINFIGNISYVIAAIIGAIFASRGIMAVGEIQSMFQYSRQFSNPIGQIAQVLNMIQSMIAASERIFNFLEVEEEVADTDKPVSIDNIKGNVSFDDISFGYNKDKLIIKDVSVDIKSGQKIAIVGPTGAGKTTIVKLLLRYYDVNKGSIKVDGEDIRDYSRSDLRSLFGMVLQDTWLFNGTVMDNLRYGKLDASDEDVINAAKAVHIDHFIHTLPDGYNMIINEESSNISSGQKQLLTMARAVLADPKILILDEATSNVDTRMELMIQKSMDQLMKGRTSFVIAHRLSTIKNADVILVMKDGNIIESGSHEELLKAKGFYFELYNSQFDKEEE